MASPDFLEDVLPTAAAEEHQAPPLAPGFARVLIPGEGYKVVEVRKYIKWLDAQVRARQQEIEAQGLATVSYYGGQFQGRC